MASLGMMMAGNVRIMTAKMHAVGPTKALLAADRTPSSGR